MLESTREELEGQLVTQQRTIEELQRQLAAQSGGSGGQAAAGGAAAGERGVLADQIAAPVATGDHARQIQTLYYIEQQVLSDPTRADPASLRLAYLAHLYRQVKPLDLLGVDPKLARDARLRIDAIYTALLTEQSDPLEQGRSAAAPNDPRSCAASALEELNRHQYLMLLGDPGSGKSTFVNFVALCLAGELLQRSIGEQLPANLHLLTAPLPTRNSAEAPKPQSWSHGALLPVRIVLCDFVARNLPPASQLATAEHLGKFIRSELKSARLSAYEELLCNELLTHGGLILLDGLDEVPEASRIQIIEAIESFADTYQKCRFLVTSRIYTYQKGERAPNGFSLARLARFDERQIATFIDRWYKHVAPLCDSINKAPQRGLLLKQLITQDKNFAELAGQPLLLTLIASLHADRDNLPLRREQLYAASVDQRLNGSSQWRVGQSKSYQPDAGQPSLVEYRKLGKERILAALYNLAFHAHANNPDPGQCALIRRADLLDCLVTASPDAGKDLVVMRLVEYLSEHAGLLLPQGDRVFSLPHRTFQEYFAACHLTGYNYPEQVADLARSEPNRWREVLLLAAARACRDGETRVWDLVDALCFRDPAAPDYTEQDDWGAHLAGLALLENVDLTQKCERHRSKIERIRRCLVSILDGGRLPAGERASAGCTLAALGDSRLAATTVEHLQFCYIPAGPFYRSGGGNLRLGDINYDYWVSRYPITNAQYMRFVEVGGYTSAEFWPEAIGHGYWRNGRFRGRQDEGYRSGPVAYRVPYKLSNHPVVGISWFEARAFCRWLTLDLRNANCLLPGWEIRLPTEMEWEKGARGGVETPTEAAFAAGSHLTQRVNPTLHANPYPQRRYPWGDDPDPTRLNCAETRISATSPIGCFATGASPYGVEDLGGNVWEWMMDAEGDEWRLLKGRAYRFKVGDVSVAERDWVVPFRRNFLIGLRVLAVPVASAA